MTTINITAAQSSDPSNSPLPSENQQPGQQSQQQPDQQQQGGRTEKDKAPQQK